jgi:peptidoglycan/xylan/chitin deacetylase (PgdA/CDA1 family)
MNIARSEYIDFSNKLMGEKTICLTLDLERDYGDYFENIAYDGLKYISNVTSFLEERKIPITVFVQGSLLNQYPEAVEAFTNLDVEFELHSYSHLRYDKTAAEKEIDEGKKAYHNYFGKNPKGYRFPSGILKNKDYKALAAAGFQYDSSIFPSIRPKAYNNLNMPTRPYYLKQYKIVEFPISVFSKFIRIPLALSYIKLLGKPYLKLINSSFLPDYFIFNFHLHDLFKLSSSALINNENKSFLDKVIFKQTYFQSDNIGFLLLQNLISSFQKRNYKFATLETVYNKLV